MNTQYVEGVQKWKKAFSMWESKITMWLYHSLKGSKTCFFSSKNQGKRSQEWVSGTPQSIP